jgi:hypothetical protein
MKTLKVTDKNKTYMDHDAVIKVGPKDEILHEAEVLRRLAGLKNVPQLLGVADMIGEGMSEYKVLTMTQVEGRPYLQELLDEMKRRGVVVNEIENENMLNDNGTIGLVGFMSRAKLTGGKDETSN